MCRDDCRVLPFQMHWLPFPVNCHAYANVNQMHKSEWLKLTLRLSVVSCTSHVFVTWRLEWTRPALHIGPCRKYPYKALHFIGEQARTGTYLCTYLMSLDRYVYYAYCLLWVYAAWAYNSYYVFVTAFTPARCSLGTCNRLDVHFALVGRFFQW